MLHDELKYYKNIIGNKHYRQIIYLSKKDYEKVELGKPYNLTAYVSKKKNKIPTALFLTKKQIKDFVMAEYEDGYFNLTLSKDQIEKTLKETQNINVKISNILDKLSNAKSNLEFRREKNLKKFIADLMKYSSKTPMLESRKQQDEKVIKSYLDKNKQIGNYYETFIRLNNVDLVKFIKKCISGDTNTSFIIDFDYKSKVKDFFPFVVYLTAKQKRFYYLWLGTKRFELEMSKTQFHKTCFASIVINRDIYYYKNYGNFPLPIKFNMKFIAPLAIEMKNVIDFDEDSIPTTTTTKSIPK